MSCSCLIFFAGGPATLREFGVVSLHVAKPAAKPGQPSPPPALRGGRAALSPPTLRRLGGLLPRGEQRRGGDELRGKHGPLLARGVHRVILLCRGTPPRGPPRFRPHPKTSPRPAQTHPGP